MKLGSGMGLFTIRQHKAQSVEKIRSMATGIGQSILKISLMMNLANRFSARIRKKSIISITMIRTIRIFIKMP